jgi:3-hydroxybutyryl-CoA dehydrogenase
MTKNAPPALPAACIVGVVGAGAMGSGIAQVVAAAGHEVRLFDNRPGAAAQAVEGVRSTFDRLAGKGRMDADAAGRAADRLAAVNALNDLEPCGLVIEAIVEDLAAKRSLFEALESVVAPGAVLATNTSSISITALAAGLRHPGRVLGLHFFNPPPLMALVEVVSGLETDAAVAASLHATAAAWGKRPVHARSTPGFIVNRVARPFYAEALRLLGEGAADVATLDAVMRDAGGFRMGPFELMDMIGHDVNYAVTRSVFDAFHGDPRFAPSLLQLELVQGGRLGRKSGRGFYDHRPEAPAPTPADVVAQSLAGSAWVRSGPPLAEALAARLRERGVALRLEASHPGPGTVAPFAGTQAGALLVEGDGSTATEMALRLGHRHVIVVDLVLDAAAATRIAVSRAAGCSDAAARSASALLQGAGLHVNELKDLPALAVLRTVAMLANEAADAVHQGVATAAEVDRAMRHGVNYPLGPLAWAERLGWARVVGALDRLAAFYGDGRYRASPWLRLQAAADACAALP